MTANTPVLALPYPLGTDPPAGHTQIQALADALEVKIPRGRLAYQTTATLQTGITSTPTTLTGISVTVAFAPGRHIQVMAWCQFAKNAPDSAAAVYLTLKDGATPIVNGISSMVAPGWQAIYLATYLTGPTGSHTFTLTGQTTAGFVNAETRWLAVHDLGPV